MSKALEDILNDLRTRMQRPKKDLTVRLADYLRWNLAGSVTKRDLLRIRLLS